MRPVVPIAVIVLALVGCAPGLEEPTEVDAIGLVVIPFEVRGQAEGAEHVGRAFAKSLAISLAPAENLRLLYVPVPDDGDAIGGATRVIEGTLTRDGDAVIAGVRLIDPSGDSPSWETQERSDTGDLSDLVHHLAAQTVEELGVSYPDLYDYVGNIAGGPAMAVSPLAASSLKSWRANDIEAFLESSSDLAESFSDDPAAHLFNAWALLLAWDAAPTREGLVQLKDRLVELDRVDPRSPYDELLRAYIYRTSGEPNKARELYSKVLTRKDLTPAARAWALRQRSLTLQQTASASAALNDANEAVRLQPSHAGNMVVLSKAFEAASRLDDAVTSSRLALALEPHRWRHQQRVGLVYARAGRLDEAVPFMDRACQISSSQEACANHAVTLSLAGRDDEGRAAVDHAESLVATPCGSYNLGCYWALTGQAASAIDRLGRAVDLGFTDALIKTDHDLDSLRQNAEFEAIVARIDERVTERRQISDSVFPWQ
jgi:tetratricopeptide (TPR) repeat protein